MKIKLLLCVILAGCTFGFAKEKADVRDVTGCLSKGDSAKEFLLTGNDGNGGSNGFAMKLNSAGDGFIYSTLFGDTNDTASIRRAPQASRR